MVAVNVTFWPNRSPLEGVAATAVVVRSGATTYGLSVPVLPLKLAPPE